MAVLRAVGQPSLWFGGTFFGDVLAWPGASLVGQGSAEGFAVRVDATGQADVGVTFGGPGQHFVSAVTSEPDGGAWVAGRFERRLDGPDGWTATSTGATDVFVARLDADGRPQIRRVLGGPGPDTATALTRTEDGGAVLAALYTGAIPWGEAGNLPMPARGTGGVVTGFAPDGAVRWVLPIGAGADVITVAGQPNSGAVIAGTMRNDLDVGGFALELVSGIDIFVIVVDASGAVTAARRFGGNELDLVRAAAVDDASGIWLTGTFQSDLRIGGVELVAEGSRDLYVARLNPDLSVQWARQYGGEAGDQVAAALTIAPDGAAIIAAGFEVEIDAGAGPIASRGAFDVLVAKLRP